VKTIRFPFHDPTDFLPSGSTTEKKPRAYYDRPDIYSDISDDDEKADEEKDGEWDIFTNLYHMYKKADIRLKEQTLNWKKLVVALEGLRAHSTAMKENETAWEAVKGLAEEVKAAGRKYGELGKEVDNFISNLMEKGLSPLLPERRS